MMRKKGPNCLAGIGNINHFHSQHYLSRTLGQKIRTLTAEWQACEEAAKQEGLGWVSPPKALAALRSHWLKTRVALTKTASPEARKQKRLELQILLLHTLGYQHDPTVCALLDSEQIFWPIRVWQFDMSQALTIAIVGHFGSDEPDILLQPMDLSCYPHHYRDEFRAFTWSDWLTKVSSNPPSYKLLFVSADEWVLVDCRKWANRKSVLRISWDEIFERGSICNFEAVAVMLHDANQVSAHQSEVPRRC